MEGLNPPPASPRFINEFPTSGLCAVYASDPKVSGEGHRRIRNMNELQAGDRLDHYRVEALAAKSGMASIYRGVDLHNDMPVAIKVPHFEVESDPLLFDRFKREDAIGRRLNHPRVMRVMTDEDRSRLYMVMEWLDGRLLRTVLTEEKKLGPDRAIRLALEICEALEYVHGQGVV